MCSTCTCVCILGTIELAASQLADKLSNLHISEVRMWAIDVCMLFNPTSHIDYASIIMYMHCINYIRTYCTYVRTSYTLDTVST